MDCISVFLLVMVVLIGGGYLMMKSAGRVDQPTVSPDMKFFDPPADPDSSPDNRNPEGE